MDDDSPFSHGHERKRRRRRVVVTGHGPEDPERVARFSVIGLAGMALLAVFGIFSSGAPLAVLHGVVWCGFGLLVLLVPPQFRSGWMAVLGGLGVLAGAGMSFLPAGTFAMPAWRAALEGLGWPGSGRVTLEPQLTMELWAGLAVSVLAAWYVMGQKVSDAGHRGLVVLVTLGIAAYGVVSMMVFGMKDRWEWDRVETFGLMGNRNHTATILVMGAVLGLGLLMEAVRGKRGGLAGVAALTMVICVWGLLGYSISRAGILLLALGVVVWAAGLGRSYFSKRFGVVLAVFLVAGGGAFWWSNAALRERLTRQIEERAAARAAAEAKALAAGEGGDVGSEGGAGSLSGSGGDMDAEPFDFREVIWRDTLVMLKGEPVTGVGLGLFGVVFPQYRDKSAVASKCWHPESNWLLIAAEAGVATAAVLALTVLGLFGKSFLESRRRRHGWSLAWATLIAAAVVPVHGLVDVTGQHVGIAWLSLVLLGLTFRRSEEGGSARELGRVGRGIWRAAGLVILAAGVWVFVNVRAEVRPSALEVPGLALTEARRLYQLDMMQKKDPAAHPAPMGADGEPVDYLEEAQKVINAALQITPLEPELHYWRGLLSVNFSDEEAIADQAFAVHRLLEPDWVEVPWRHGSAWLSIDKTRAFTLWREALRRAEEGDRVSKGVYWSPSQLMKRMKAATAKMPDLKPEVEALEKSITPALPITPAPPTGK